MILDAGTGIRRLGKELMSGPSGKGEGDVHLLISHTHWDHIQGIPFFAPLYVRGNRINIYARQRDVHLKTIFSSQTEDPYFPVSLEEVAAEVTYNALMEGEEFRIGDARVRCARLNHPFIAIGYRIEDDQGALAYVSDTAPFDRIVFEHEFIAGRPDISVPPPEPDAAKLRHMRQAVVDLCRGCDLVIYDTMFRMEEYLARPHWGHSCPEQAVEIVEDAAAGALMLFHHAPSRSDDQVDEDLQRVAACTSIPVMAAAEGLHLDIASGIRRVEE
jgi:phosphoribosyl 1,2-cyclic phosphodiesterase